MDLWGSLSPLEVMTKTGDEARVTRLKSFQLCPVSLWVSSNDPHPYHGSLYVSRKGLKHWQNSIIRDCFHVCLKFCTKPQLATNWAVPWVPNIRGTLFFTSTLTFAIHLCFSKLIYKYIFSESLSELSASWPEADIQALETGRIGSSCTP